MGRFADLCGDVAAALEEDVDGFTLPPEAWARFREEWKEEDIEDAVGLVQESVMQDELVDAADSLSARMVEWLGDFGGESRFRDAEGGQARLSLDIIGQLTRRVGRLEDALSRYRDKEPAANPGFETLRRRLADHGIEAEMGTELPEEPVTDPSEEEE